MSPSWTPVTYIRHLNAQVLVPKEAQWAVGMHNFRCDAFVDRRLIQRIQHFVRKGLPIPSWPVRVPEGEDAHDIYNRRIAQWEREDIIEAHTFSLPLADLIQNPACPVCGRNEGESPLFQSVQIETGKMAYRAIVHSWSEKSFRYFSKPECVRRQRERLHLDHIYPVSLGFANGIPEEVISSPVNLQGITESENLAKAANPGMSLTDLWSSYDKWISENPAWAELVSARRSTNAWPVSENVKVPRRYASDEERDEAHRERMVTAYLLWERGYEKREIAKIMGLWESTLAGRIQLDKKYLGGASIFYTKSPRNPLPDEALLLLEEQQKALRSAEANERKKKDRPRGLTIRISTSLRSGETCVDDGT